MRNPRQDAPVREFPERRPGSGIALTTAAISPRSLAATHVATRHSGDMPLGRCTAAFRRVASPATSHTSLRVDHDRTNRHFSMRSLRLTLILISVFATLLCIAPMASTAMARSARPRTVLFDATFTAQRTAGPDADQVGHRQIASGVLRNSTGRAVGRFAFTCIWTRILAGGDALERCRGFGHTADGRLEVAGPARESEAVHHWKLTGESDVYRGAHGTLLVRDIGDRESLITAMVSPRAGTVLQVAVIARPAADASLVADADHLCTRASRQLDRKSVV